MAQDTPLLYFKMKKYHKRLCFKTRIKAEWSYTFWYGCDNKWDLPYDLYDFFQKLCKILDNGEIYFKIETKRE